MVEDRMRKVKSILITLPKPETEKSPYFDRSSMLKGCRREILEREKSP
jgi:hypothetical protein